MSVLIQNEPLAYDVPIYIYRHNPYTNCSSNSLVNTLEILLNATQKLKLLI